MYINSEYIFEVYTDRILDHLEKVDKKYINRDKFKKKEIINYLDKKGVR